METNFYLQNSIVKITAPAVFRPFALFEIEGTIISNDSGEYIIKIGSDMHSNIKHEMLTLVSLP